MTEEQYFTTEVDAGVFVAGRLRSVLEYGVFEGHVKRYKEVKSSFTTRSFFIEADRVFMNTLLEWIDD